MNEHEALAAVGQAVVAVDIYWGMYTGELIGIEFTNSWRVEVKIITCIEQPSQRAIFWPEQTVTRDAYKPGNIHIFELDNLTMYQGTELAEPA